MTTVARAITDWLVYELQREGFRWESNVARYRDLRTGRFVAEKTIINTAEGFAELTQRSMTNVTDRFLSGKIGIQDWQAAMRREIKDAHLVNAMAGRGGRQAMTQADWGRAGARLRVEYGHLDNFAWEITSGNLSDKQIQARVNLYANKSRSSYFDGKTSANQAAQFTEERRVLNPAEHCDDCIGYAALGWVTIGTLPEPGEASVCRANCKCNKEYR